MITHPLRERGLGPAPVALAVAGLATLLGACAGSAAGNSSASAADGDVAATVCDDPLVRDPHCRTLSIGDRSVRYALRRADPPTTATVLVDVGGPGDSVLATPMSDRVAGIRPELSGMNILTIEEPWVTAPVDASCRDAASSWYQAQRRGDTSGGADMVAACALDAPGTWAFDRSSYRTTVAEIVAAESLELEGYLGFSFGSVRRGYLDADATEWTVLVRPMPLGVTGPELLRARAELVEPLAERLPDDVTSSRSLPVTTFDLDSAALAVGYLDDEVRAAAHEDLAAGSSELVGQLSDQVWLRYGVDDVSPATFAYLDELCPALPGWESLDLATASGPESILAARHEPCRHVPSSTTPPDQYVAACLVVSDLDPVAPGRLARASDFVGVATRVVSVDGGMHHSLDGVADCVGEALGAS